MGLVSADLIFSDIEVKINNDEDSGASTTGGSVEIKPGAELDIKVTIENDGEFEVRNVDFEAILEEIDEDDDDMDADDDVGDINTGKDKVAKVEFILPYLLDHEETYYMVLKADGRDENGTNHEVEITVEMEIDKESHALYVEEYYLSKSSVKCGEDVELFMQIRNIGEDEEEEVEIEVFMDSELYGFEDTVELTSDISDPDNIYEKSVTIDTADWPTEDYSIKLAAFYDGKHEYKSNSTVLHVICEDDSDTSTSSGSDANDDSSDTESTGSDESDNSSDNDSDDTTKTNDSTSDADKSNESDKSESQESTTGSADKPVNTNVAVKSSTNVVKASSGSGSSILSGEFFGQNKLAVILVIGEILLILVAVLVILLVLSRRNKN